MPVLPRRPPSVLIIDDEPEVRSLLRCILEAHGFRVIEAENGRLGQEYAEREMVDVVVTDLVMPEKEGIETIVWLRRSCPEKKIIAISGAFGGSYLKVATALGADAALAKPVRGEYLIGTIQSLLAENGSEAKK
jgi:DNA-binding response OmpR family regulator